VFAKKAPNNRSFTIIKNETTQLIIAEMISTIKITFCFSSLVYLYISKFNNVNSNMFRKNKNENLKSIGIL
jgi:hypothetical protein